MNISLLSHIAIELLSKSDTRLKSLNLKVLMASYPFWKEILHKHDYPTKLKLEILVIYLTTST